MAGLQFVCTASICVFLIEHKTKVNILTCSSTPRFETYILIDTAWFVKAIPVAIAMGTCVANSGEAAGFKIHRNVGSAVGGIRLSYRALQTVEP